MDNIKILLRIAGYSGFALFFIQILNLYIELFEPSETLFEISFVTGIGALFILVLLDKFTNKEDKFYSKNIEK